MGPRQANALPDVPPQNSSEWSKNRITSPLLDRPPRYLSSGFRHFSNWPSGAAPSRKGSTRRVMMRRFRPTAVCPPASALRPCSVDSQRDYADALRLAQSNDIKTCKSNECFDVWYLAHFARSCRQFNDCDLVTNELSRHWMAEFNRDYRKNDRNIFNLLFGRLHQTR